MPCEFADRRASAQPREQVLSAPRYTRLMLDRDDRIAFASTDIEQWLGLDYESVAGLHITSLLPELTACLGHNKLHSHRMRQFEQMGMFRTYALHANGNQIPVIVSLQEGFRDSTIPLLLLRPAPPEPAT